MKTMKMARSGLLYFVFSVNYHEKNKLSNNKAIAQDNPLWSNRSIKIFKIYYKNYLRNFRNQMLHIFMFKIKLTDKP